VLIVKDLSIVLVGLCHIERVNSMSDCYVRPTASCRQDGTTVTANQVQLAISSRRSCQCIVEAC